MSTRLWIFLGLAMVAAGVFFAAPTGDDTSLSVGNGRPSRVIGAGQCQP